MYVILSEAEGGVEESPQQVRCFVGSIHELPAIQDIRECPLQNIFACTIIESNSKQEILRLRFTTLRMTFNEL